MLSWFSKEKDKEKEKVLVDNEKVEETEDEEDEETDDEETEDEEFDFLKNKMYEDENVKFYATDARDLVPNIKIWSTQRSINQDHVKELINNLKNHNHFIGTIKVVRDELNNIRIIDGQHRFCAIKKLIEKDSKFNMNIILELYETDNLDSEKTMNLFHEANSCLNVSKNDMPNVIANSIVRNLCQRFPKMIIEVKEDKRCNRPRINKRELYLKIKNYVSETSRNESDILEQIFEKNNDYGCRGRQTFKNTTTQMFQKCKDSGLYLGLDLNFEWLNKIDW